MEAKFIKMEDDMAEYEIVEKVPNEVTNGKEYKKQKIPKKETKEKELSKNI